MKRRLTICAACLTICCALGLVWPAFARAGGNHDLGKKPDPACVSYDLQIWAIIETNENDRLESSQVLVDVATLLQDAKSICARGDVDSALTIYKSALQDLTAHLRELD